RGIASIVLDVRRGDGPKECFGYTMGAIATTDGLIARSPEAAAGVVRAIVRTQAMLRQDIAYATTVGRALFPSLDGQLIAAVVKRALPFYSPAISEQSVASMNRYCCETGMLQEDAPYWGVVAAEFSGLWNELQPNGTGSAAADRTAPTG